MSAINIISTATPISDRLGSCKQFPVELFAEPAGSKSCICSRSSFHKKTISVRSSVNFTDGSRSRDVVSYNVRAVSERLNYPVEVTSSSASARQELVISDAQRKTKIVFTIGPSTSSREMIWKLAETGMDGARLNMSHGDHASHQKTIDLVKEYNAQFQDKSYSYTALTQRYLQVIGLIRSEVGRQADSSMANKPGKLSVYLYIPNIIGYVRVLINCIAFAQCFSNKKLFSVLYFISFVCDGIDGWAARKFNQVSTFGAVLDMVTDRISTACLLVILSQVYRPGLLFLSLLALDIGSHWLQMYSTFLLGKVSHKDVKDSTNWLFRAYYGNRIFMAYCCVACEVLYILLFLLTENQNENLTDVVKRSLQQSSFLSFLFALSLFGWMIKQTINVIQMKTAADVCVLYDINRKQKA